MTTSTPSVQTRFYLFDRLIIGYCVLMIVLIGLLGRPIGQYLDEIVLYALTVIVVLLVVRYVDEQGSHLFRLMRLAYPVLLLTFFYRATGGLMSLVFDRFFDDQLTAFELAALGVNPTLLIDQYVLNTWVNEVLSLCYFCFYPMIPVFVLVLFFTKRYEIIKSLLAAVCLTFFLSYLLFFLYPLEGPRWHFAADYVNRIEGPVFRQLVELVIDNAAVRGGAMPSSHFGVALVILLYTFRHFPKAGWPVLLVNLGLAAGTVWGRFHYVSDVVVGGLLGLLCTFVVWKYHRVPERGSAPEIAGKELTTEHVS